MIKSSFELFYCVLETPTKSIYVPVSIAVCSLLGFLIFVFVTKKLIRYQSKKKLVAVEL